MFMRKFGKIFGLVAAVGAILCGGAAVLLGLSTASMAKMMKAKGAGVTTMIDYTCDTCGIDGSATSGYSEIVDGTPCGYISGQAVRCLVKYTVEERKMTEEEQAELERGQASWDRMLDGSQTVRFGGILVMLAGLLMGVGAFGCLKDKGWGLPVEGAALLLGITGVGIGISALVTIFSGS